MKAIFKYPLELGGATEVEMPVGAEILSLQVQGNVRPCLWAISDVKETQKVKRTFRPYFTGETIPENIGELSYLGTVQTGPLVWHIFEEKRTPFVPYRMLTPEIVAWLKGHGLDTSAVYHISVYRNAGVVAINSYERDGSGHFIIDRDSRAKLAEEIEYRLDEIPSCFTLDSYWQTPDGIGRGGKVL